MDSRKYFSDPVIDELKRAVREAGGNEVFFTGDIDSSGIVVSVNVGARGNESEVPVNQNDVRE